MQWWREENGGRRCSYHYPARGVKEKEFPQNAAADRHQLILIWFGMNLINCTNDKSHHIEYGRVPCPCTRPYTVGSLHGESMVGPRKGKD